MEPRRSVFLYQLSRPSHWFFLFSGQYFAGKDRRVFVAGGQRLAEGVFSAPEGKVVHDVERGGAAQFVRFGAFRNKFPAGTAPILIGMMFLGAVQLFFIGIIGEYILTMNTRLMKRPLVIEEKRINFGDVR